MRNLPNEVILNIARRLDPADIHVLALSFCGINHVVKEALLQNATIKPNKIFQVIDELNRHPSLSIKMTHLRLGPIDDERDKEMREMGPILRNMPAAGYHGCCQIIRKAYKTIPLVEPTLLEDGICEVTDFFDVGLLLLMAQLHSLNAITISSSTLERMELARLLFHDISTPNLRGTKWVKDVRSLLEGKLETLVVTQDLRNSQALGQPHELHLHPFKLLKSLKVPYSWLLTDRSIPPHHLVPRTVEELIVHWDAADYRIPYWWFLTLLNNPTTYWPRLKMLELRFDLTCQSAGVRFGRRPSRLADLLDSSSVDIKTTFGTVNSIQIQGVDIYNTTAHVVDTWVPGDLVQAMEYNGEQQLKGYGSSMLKGSGLFSGLFVGWGD